MSIYCFRESVGELMKNVREAMKGLRVDPVQVPPWEWRKGLLPKGKS
jgi:hypothetical protein